ncbi:MAG: hypothetical protein NWQ14_10075 [Flavobacterium sp.]|jgi:hypothetical protein|nr:hypothetical protein [Flavobacterium sp.]
MKHKLLIILAITSLFFSCSKDEGYGGLASISGRVFGKDYNSNGVLVSSNYLGGAKVYIGVHGSSTPFDDVDTSYDGTFRFEYLQKGTYDIWVFGDCDSCSWDQTYVVKTIEITSRKSSVTTDDLIITF